MSQHAPGEPWSGAARAGAMERSFVRFYEGLLLVLGDVPLTVVLEREPGQSRWRS